MSDDIVDRLRLTVKCPEHGKDCGGDACCCADSHDYPVMGGELFTDAADEIERLRRWKAEATAVIERWEAAWQAAGSPGELGDTKSGAMLAEITRLRAEVERLLDVLRLVDNDSYMLPIATDETVTAALAAYEAQRGETT